jgi:hypothetical protein
VPKFELYKHNDELFSMYYRIFYELWTFADFDRFCKLKKRGDEILKKLLLGNYWANLNQTLLKWFLDGPLPKLCPVIPTSNWDGRQGRDGPWVVPFQNCVRQPRPPFKRAAVTKNRNFFNCPLLL